ncbi:MAG: MATE family efflux transporter [Coriobacteriales bacterium]|nr:MATE family efflux transporter [Coriobacteriales bacterium]
MNMKKAGDKTAIFETMSVPKALAIMSLPAVVAQLVATTYGIADAWFIGCVDNPYMIAASSLVQTFYLILMALATLFGSGGGNLLARQLGKGDSEGARKTASYSIVMAAIVVLCFSLICLVFMEPILRILGASDNTLGFAKQYVLAATVVGGVPIVLSSTMPMILRSAGYSKEAGIGVAMASIINIALDPLLMFVILPDGYQVLAAGIATALANVIALAYFILMYRKVGRSSVLEVPKRLEHLDATSLKSLYSVGLPAAIALLLFSVVTIVLNLLAASYGDITLAALGIVLKVERLPQNVGMAICLCMVPLVAYNFGRGDLKRMDSFFSATRRVLLALGLLSMGICIVFAQPIVSAFLDDPEVVHVGTALIRVRAISFPLMLLGLQTIYFTQAVDRGKLAFVLSVTRYVLLCIPSMLILNALFGIDGLTWSQSVSDTVFLIVAIFTYLRVRKQIGTA